MTYAGLKARCKSFPSAHHYARGEWSEAERRKAGLRKSAVRKSAKTEGKPNVCRLRLRLRDERTH